MNSEKEKIYLNKLLNDALLALQNKKPKLAIESLRKILNTRPNNPQVLNLLSIAYNQTGELLSALDCIKKAIKINSKEEGFYINLGNINKNLKNYAASKKAYESVISFNPNSAEAYYNIGVIYTEQHKYSESIKYYQKAIEFDSSHKYSFDNLGNAYMELAAYDKAINSFNAAINIDNNFYQSQHNLSFVLLLTNSFKLGWKKYEYRLKKNSYLSNKPFSNYIYWNGSSLSNKKLLIYCEQGIGDNIQFARYIKKIKKDKTKIILYCNKNMSIFFKNFKEIDQIIFPENKIPNIDYYISIMSLPFIFSNNCSIPQSYQFFKVNEKKINEWNLKLKKLKKIKVGIVWQGRKSHNFDYKRSITLNKMQSIFNLKNIQFISLQKDYGSEQIKSNKLENIILDFSAKIDKKPFEDTLAIIENLDLVLGIDTSIIHISATLRKKTWVMIPYVPDFRWGLKKSTTPWYDSIKLFRQKKLDDWDSVICEIRNELIKLSNS